MDDSNRQRQLRLHGHDTSDLEQRLRLFREALQQQRGAILHIAWSIRRQFSEQSALVLYRIPAASIVGSGPSTDRRTAEPQHVPEAGVSGARGASRGSDDAGAALP